MAIVKPGSLFSLQGDYPYQMKNQPKYRWWKPICAGLLTLVLIVVFDYLSYAIIYRMTGGDPQVSAALSPSTNGSYTSGDTTSPVAMLMNFIPIALIIPSVGISSRVFGLGGLKALSSVEGGLRWKRFLSYVPLTLGVALLFNLVTFAFNALQGASWGDATFAPLTLILIIILCPLQCAGEEYLYRGFVFQTFASWIPIVVIPFIIQMVLFVIGHGYNIIGLMAVGFTGLCTAWLTVKTGGLEAAITLHSINNVISFMTSALFVSQTVMSDTTIDGLIVDVVYAFILTIVLYQIAKRKGYIETQRTEVQPAEA